MQLTELASNHCAPLRGSEHFLSVNSAQNHLNALPGWELAENGHAIRKTFHFKDYYQTIAFVNALAFIAHRENHHPDLTVHYDRVIIRYSTHDVGGLSENDFICAAKVDVLFT